MNPFLIVEAQGFGTAEIAAFNWNEYILIRVQSENLGNAKALAIQRSKMGPYTHMNQFLIVEARGFGTAKTSHFELG